MELCRREREPVRGRVLLDGAIFVLFFLLACARAKRMFFEGAVLNRGDYLLVLNNTVALML